MKNWMIIGVAAVGIGLGWGALQPISKSEPQKPQTVQPATQQTNRFSWEVKFATRNGDPWVRVLRDGETEVRYLVIEGDRGVAVTPLLPAPKPATAER